MFRQNLRPMGVEVILNSGSPWNVMRDAPPQRPILRHRPHVLTISGTGIPNPISSIPIAL